MRLLERPSRRFDRFTKDLIVLGKVPFVAQASRRKLVGVTARDLGMKRMSIPRGEIYSEAIRQGLLVCNKQVGPELYLVRPSQKGVIASEPMILGSDLQLLFEIKERKQPIREGEKSEWELSTDAGCSTISFPNTRLWLFEVA